MSNLIGAHCSVSGGLENAFDEAKSLNVDAFQIFTRNQRQWQAKPISPEESKTFAGAFKASEVTTIFSHSSYLLNLASINPDIWNKSVDALTDELVRCNELGLAFTVLHPGSAKDHTPEAGIKKIAKGLKQILKNTKSSNVKILLENTAGQGATLGYTFEQLGEIMDRSESERLGICFDTCHAYAAGFDIRTKDGIEDTISQLDKIIGLSKLNALHLNDSKGELGSHLDRHEHIGKGQIGKVPFKWLVNTFIDIPKVIETPKSEEMDAKNLFLLNSFVK